MSDESDETTGPESPPPGLAAGMDLVRRTLDEARSAARKQNKDVGRGRASAGRNQPVRSEPVRNGRRRWSGPGPDSRDPQSLGSVTSKLSRDRGWSAKVAEGSVLGMWSSVVGEQIADHAAPVALRDGVLTIEAESTAWATQLRMVQAQVLAKIAASVGDGVVTSLRILGPAGPTWRKGPRHIAGRGPRDTYG